MTNATKAKQQRKGQPARKGAKGAKGAKGKKTTGGNASLVWLGLGALAFVAVVAAVIISSGAGGDSGKEPAEPGTVEIARSAGAPLAEGEAIPEWSAPTLDGEDTMRWSDHVGQPTVLAVWAPWCPHCQAELPRLAEALADHPGIQIVTISTGVGQGNTPSQAYLDSRGLDFPVAVDDADQTLMRGLGVGSYPGTYFVNADGTVYRYTTGEIGLLEDGSVDESVLDGILTDLEAANQGSEAA